jgi:hypothetical protein
VLPNDMYGKYVHVPSAALFKHHHGSSWHGGDAALLKNLVRHRTLVVLFLAVTGAAIACFAAGRRAGRLRDIGAGFPLCVAPSGKGK